MAKERPIIFSVEMVRAILAGRKTQTRRVVKPQPQGDYLTIMPDGQLVGICKDGHRIGHDEVLRRGESWLCCPYGQPGDRLWVRETWNPKWDTYDSAAGPHPGVRYAVDFVDHVAAGKSLGIRWRPSIFMPRWASRITLEVVRVGVERVQEITDDDAIEEGVDRTNTSIPTYARQRFCKLWDSINAKRGYGWDTDPWVWVVEFRITTPTP